MSYFRYYYLLGTYLLLIHLAISPTHARIDTLRAFPEKRFVNGVVSFNQYMMINLRYPLNAQQSAIMGTSLVSLIITSAGKLSQIAIVNSLGAAIDEEVRRVVGSTKKMWMPVDPSASQDSIMLFLPVEFTMEDQSGNNTFYVEPVKPDFILGEIVVVGYNPQITYGLHDDTYYINELSEALPKKDYKRMLKCVNELIRRNPYSDKLYMQRANIKQQLGQTDAACSDYKKIIYFLGRKGLPKAFLQNCGD